MSLVRLQPHNQKLGDQRNNMPDSDPLAQGKVQVTGTPSQALLTQPTSPLSPSSQDTRPSTVSSSEVLRLYRSRQRPSGSIVSHNSTVWVYKNEDLPYPVIPKRSAETAYVYCSIWSDPLRASTLTEDKWRCADFLSLLIT
jgi:hypothetical protein